MVAMPQAAMPSLDATMSVTLHMCCRSAGSRSAGSSPSGLKLRQPTDEQFLLPNMPWHDWEIAEDDIVIDRRPDGSEWELGTGAFGKVRLTS